MDRMNKAIKTFDFLSIGISGVFDCADSGSIKHSVVTPDNTTENVNGEL